MNPKPPPQRLAPQGCTNFKLRQLLRSVSRLYDAQLARAGLKGTQYSLLSHVQSLGPIAPSTLAQRMGMDASTLTRNLRPLITQGWVLQGPGADGRVRSITITPAGEAKQREAKACWRAAQQSLNGLLGEDTVAALHGLVDDAQARLQAHDAAAEG